jgi:hypothetical protein
LGDQVERFGGAAGEHQLVLGPAPMKRLSVARAASGGALAQRVHAAVDVGAVVRLELRMASSTASGICVVAALSR